MNRPGKRVSAEKGKHRLGPEKTSTRNPKKRIDEAEKNKQLTVDETLFFLLSFRTFQTVVPQLALRA